MIVIIISVSICFLVFIITSSIVLIRRRINDRLYPGRVISGSIAAPVVVTSATRTVPSGYTVAQMPISSTTTSYEIQSYSASHQPQGFRPNVVPYPAMLRGSMNPPAYDVAVSHVVVNESQTCNPNYRM